jgi:hypothetical protein
MALGDRQQLVTLDIPNGSNGYLPLDPATWYCAVRSEGSGGAFLTGEYHPGITVHTRVHLKGRVFHVDAIVNTGERDVELQLTCREVFDT